MKESIFTEKQLEGAMWNMLNITNRSFRSQKEYVNEYIIKLKTNNPMIITLEMYETIFYDYNMNSKLSDTLESYVVDKINALCIKKYLPNTYLVIKSFPGATTLKVGDCITSLNFRNVQIELEDFPNHFKQLTAEEIINYNNPGEDLYNDIKIV